MVALVKTHTENVLKSTKYCTTEPEFWKSWNLSDNAKIICENYLLKSHIIGAEKNYKNFLNVKKKRRSS